MQHWGATAAQPLVSRIDSHAKLLYLRTHPAASNRTLRDPQTYRVVLSSSVTMRHPPASRRDDPPSPYSV